jgi:membrane-associated phospholipid phosphatase
MHLTRRALMALSLAFVPVPLRADPARDALRCEVLLGWYRLLLELVRHTATYSPPVASRSFAYLGVIAHEAQVGLVPGPVTLAGQLNGLSPLPEPAAGVDAPTVLCAALAQGMADFFGNTGPSGQRAMEAVGRDLAASVEAGLDPALVAASKAQGLAIAAHVRDWSDTDGGAVIENMGFPLEYTPASGPADWRPTNTQNLQQAPLLPDWGNNRPFALPAVTDCPAPAFPAYSEDTGAAFFAAAKAVYDTAKSLTPDQVAIARFWSDDPMLSPTPPGHWVSIVLQIAERDALPADRTAGILAVVGVAVADAFIGCWHQKFTHNLLRPVTYIRRHIDPAWEPLLITPPFPEYPSGHSVQSGAAEVALTALLGADFAFADATHADDGLAARSFASFRDAAEEAAISRLYGGIHYPFGNTGGLQQGRCIGAHAAGLKVWA